jgi:thiamine kinase-like enzyme
MNDMIAEITRQFEIDQKSGRKAAHAGDIPISYEAITPEWLTHVVCRGVPGAKVASYHLDTPDNGSSNRRRIFIEYNAVGSAANLPKSVFCKASTELLNRIMLAVSGCAHAETMFYNKVRPLVDIEAPEALFAAYDRRSYASIIVLRDLGAEVSFCNEATGMNWERALSQVSLLAKFHGRFYESPEIKSGDLQLPTWPQAWGYQVNNGLEEYTNKGFREAKDIIPARLYARYSEIWPASALSVELHKGRPQTLTHGDVHLKNWYVRNGNTMGLSDWQVASTGHWSRDLAYAISSALTVEQRRMWEADLIKNYLERLAQCGADIPSFAEAWTFYRQQLPAALAFWTVTLTPAPTQPEMQPRATTLEFIKRIAHAMDDVDSLDSFG